MMNRYAFLFTFVSVISCVVVHAKDPQFIKDYESTIDELEEEILTTIKFPWSNTRPDRCAVQSEYFGDIAQNMATLALSLTDGKCFEKYSEIISELAQRGNKDQAEGFKQYDVVENGALIDTQANMVINISNTQVQNVQNQNSLVSGLFTVANDEDCLETLRKKGKLASLGTTISRIGAFGFLIPSTAGLIGSSAAVVLGTSLYALDKILRPKFGWQYQKERREFITLTCAFYNLRTELIRAGFFEVKTGDNKTRLKQTHAIAKKTAAIISELEEFHEEFRTEKIKKRNGKITTKTDKNHAILYDMIEDFQLLLNSSMAAGSSVDDRLATIEYFNQRREEFLSVLKRIDPRLPLNTKIKKLMTSFSELSTMQALALSARAWQLGFIQSLNFYMESLRSHYFKAVDIKNKKFAKVEKKYAELYHRLLRIKRDLKTHETNLTRKEKESSFDEFSDGNQNRFDILKEYQKVSNVLFGEKGWKFLAFLMKEAKHNHKLFKKQYENWHKQIKASPKDKRWLCRDAFSIARTYDLADASVEFAYDFLATNVDLLTSHYPKRRYVAKIIPAGKSFQSRIVRSMLSVEKAKDVLHDDADKKTVRETKREISGLGKFAIKIKSMQEKRAELDGFRMEYCL